MSSWPCITIRVCRRSSTWDSATPSTSRSVCPYCAPASITAPPCPWRAPARRIREVCAPHWRSPWSWQVRAPALAVRKRFGQHFLHDAGIIRRIVDAVAPVAGDRIVEVGPGRGALTWGLLARAETLDVIEIDHDLAHSLAADSRARSRLRVHVENVLDTDFVRLRAEGAPLRIVGNLPYNISTPLLFHLLAQRAAI